ncbi:MAG TPA: glutathione S-transferase N-terminal domain-containing protein [Thermoleophilaceae bacterium]|nr:glutathione S-transferase N-terminal domain-containing protein [Thermoleophilaceae bacterium]
MPDQPKVVLHAVPFSHPCLAVQAVLDRHGLEYEKVDLVSGPHADEIERIYGEGKRTVPGLLVDDEPVHGTTAIFEKLDELVDDADLYPAAVAAAIREAERGIAEDLQTTARNLVFGALHFRPEALGTFAGTGPLDPAGTDFAIRMVRGAWRYIGISAELLATTLSELPEQLDIVDELIEGGVAGGDDPTAVDFQLGSSLHLLLQIGDVRPLIEGRPAGALVDRWFEPGPADIPAGAFPAGWVPERSQSAA